ncbi:hypothetical protein RSSM_04800 [Rhodopirellula sallentina SM41]|uniref:Uncharacterized protein n=1 Tax=Rhodopirellula sallentina SM41 TaxID=1263870 RepID=M5UCQ3_9BACT|nr:hypothetical protein RSSM_04800 [Rhodopirellula sallentina SM41]
MMHPVKPAPGDLNSGEPSMAENVSKNCGEHRSVDELLGQAP